MPDDLSDIFKAYGRREILRQPSHNANYDPTESVSAQAVEIDDGIPSRRGVTPL